MSLKRIYVLAMLAGAGLLVPAAAHALQAGCTQAKATVTCTYTAGTNAFTVPAKVRRIPPALALTRKPRAVTPATAT